MPTTNPILDSAWRAAVGTPDDRGPLTRHLARLLVEFVRPIEFSSLLDVGCGDGRLLQNLTRSFRPKTVVGVDVDEVALREADKNVFGEFRCLDIESEGVEGKFDLVTCLRALERMHDPRAALAHIKPSVGGALVVVALEGGPGNGAGPIPRGGARSLLEEAGFEIEREQRWGWPLCAGPVRGAVDKVMDTVSPRRGSPLRWAASELLYQLYRINADGRGDVVFLHARAR